MSSSVSSPITTLSDREVSMTRHFSASPDRVYEAYTDPAIITRWWGLQEFQTSVSHLDPRPGGSWRFVQTDPADGSELVFHGEFRDVVPGDRLVNTWQFEGMPDLVMVDTTRFEAVDGGTRVTVVSSFDSIDQRDAMLASGLEGGANDLWDRLEAVLAESV